MEILDSLTKPYEVLKEDVIKLAGDCNISDIKRHYSRCINSNRLLSRLKSLHDLIHALEIRGCISEKNLTHLYYLAAYLKNLELKEEIRTYNKVYLDDEDLKCTHCGLECVHEFSPVPNVQIQKNENEEVINNEWFGEVAKILAWNIGEKWRVLARELDVLECQIDHIQKTFPNDNFKQAWTALQIWWHTAKGKVDLQKLVTALDSRMCKKKGIGSFMIRPVIGLTLEVPMIQQPNKEIFL